MTTVDRVYLARHGQTALNADGRLRGLSDPPLDEVGIGEVQRLAQVLAAKHPSVVISSPLGRAVATAKMIAQEAHVAAVVDARLNDRDYGPWTGKVKADVLQQFGSLDDAPGVEPSDAVTARARTAFFELIAEFRTGPLVLVSHDAINRALLAALDPRLADIGQRTGCWNQLSRVEGTWRIDYYDQKPGTDNGQS